MEVSFDAGAGAATQIADVRRPPSLPHRNRLFLSAASTRSSCEIWLVFVSHEKNARVAVFFVFFFFGGGGYKCTM